MTPARCPLLRHSSPSTFLCAPPLHRGAGAVAARSSKPATTLGTAAMGPGHASRSSTPCALGLSKTRLVQAHEAAWCSAAPGASIAAGGGHGLHSLQRPQWKRDTFPISPEAHEISVTELMKLHFIQIHRARRLS